MPGKHKPAYQKSHPYAGRWLARIGSQVLAQGSSPALVRSTASQIRHKEKSLITFIPSNNIMSFPEVFYKIQSILTDRDDVFLVGGAVRDALLQKPIHDLDFVCLHDPQSAARKIANSINGKIYCMDKEHQVYRVIHSGTDSSIQIIDFMLARSPIIEDDLQMRDFTINAMAVNLQDPQKIIDPLLGAQHLSQKVLKGCKSSTFFDDPIRILRGIRIAAEGEYQIDKQTREWMKKSVTLLGSTSVERRRDEFVKIMVSPKPDAAIRALLWLNALEHLIPEYNEIVKNHGKGWRDKYLSDIVSSNILINLLFQSDPHIGAPDIVQGIAINELRPYKKHISDKFIKNHNVSNPPLAIWYLGWLGYVISAEIGQADYCENFAQWLHLSKQEMETFSCIPLGIKHLEKLASKGNAPDNLDVYRYFREIGENGIAVSWMWLCHKMAKQKIQFDPDQWANDVILISRLWQNYWVCPELINPPQLINGHDIISALGINPSQKIGEFLKAISEEQVMGRINTKDEAIRFIKKYPNNSNN